MKLDTHVHTRHSGYSTIRPLQRIMRESYNTTEGVYQMTRERGMDLVTITDHDTITGALELADRPDVIIGAR
jgi:predicted metal-dependent phosphoesterase TrpH